MLPLICVQLFSSLLAAIVLLPVKSGQLPGPFGYEDVPAHLHAAAERPPIYIIQVRKPARLLSASPEEVEEWHRSFLPSPTLDSGEPRMVFSYHIVMSGFAARLTPEEVEAMESKEGFLRAQLDQELIPQTTYSPDFLGLRRNVWNATNRGKGAIIGIIDTGVSEEHLSFTGSEISDPPEGWNGWCFFYYGRTCNDKILGATYLGMLPPSDENGHGTHVAGIAAGVPFPLASIRDSEIGTAAGVAPEAYLSIYKASRTCELLWSLERAIKDGVHIISISLSSPRIGESPGFYMNAIAKGALEAVKRGILVVCAACNNGPSPGSVCNDAPWIMTVGASTMGRALTTILRLGNGEEIPGESVYDGNKMLNEGLVFPGADGAADARFCEDLGGAPKLAAGQVVMCYRGNISGKKKAEVVERAGGIAVILMNRQLEGSIVPEVPAAGIPVVAVNFEDGEQLIKYARKPNPVVDIIPGATSYDASPFPVVPAFSGRGPSLDNFGNILKPDILGPGVNILSAEAGTLKGYVLKSGTSMATPHLSGIAAILNLHLSKETGFGWNPAMIRSAIMTTAIASNNRYKPITDQTGGRASLLAIGAGHVHPPAAMDPGLVYDISVVDYVRYLCGLGYTEEEMFATVDWPFNCDKPSLRLDPEQLNYPSITVTLLHRRSRSKTIRRTLMSVRSERSKYTAELSFLTQGTMAHVDVRVTPETLQFRGLRDNQTYDVIFSVRNGAPQEEFNVEGHLRWFSDKREYTVSSPFLVQVKTNQRQPRSTSGWLKGGPDNYSDTRASAV